MVQFMMNFIKLYKNYFITLLNLKTYLLLSYKIKIEDKLNTINKIKKGRW